MNPKIQKISEEIEKVKRKLADYQNRLRDLERQKTELENADIVALVRGVDVLPDELIAFIKAYRGQPADTSAATTATIAPYAYGITQDEKEGADIENQ